MKKIIVFICFFLSHLAHSANPPAYCQEGKVDTSFPEPSECHSPDPQLRALFIDRGLCKSSQGMSNGSMDGYLKVDIGKYLLIGSTIRVKGDGDWLKNGNGAKEQIGFFDSITGHIGTVRTNTEGNAYLSYGLHNGYIGSGKIWVINHEYYNVCSKKDVFFQHKPHIGLHGMAPFNITGSLGRYFSGGFPFYYEVDWNSKAVQENKSSQITLYAKPANSSRKVVGTASVSNRSGTVTINPSGYSVSNGIITFSVEINDGTYSSGEVVIGTLKYSEGIPTACLARCPSSMQSGYRQQCQASSLACNYRVW